MDKMIGFSFVPSAGGALVGFGVGGGAVGFGFGVGVGVALGAQAAKTGINIATTINKARIFRLFISCFLLLFECAYPETT